MTLRRGAAALLATIVLILGGTLIPAGLPLATAPAAAASGLTTTADTRYVVDPTARRVHVAVTLVATNHLKDTKTRRFFFDRSFMAVPPGSTGFPIRTSGASPPLAATARRSSSPPLPLHLGQHPAAGARRAVSLPFDIPRPARPA